MVKFRARSAVLAIGAGIAAHSTVHAQEAPDIASPPAPTQGPADTEGNVWPPKPKFGNAGDELTLPVAGTPVNSDEAVVRFSGGAPSGDLFLDRVHRLDTSARRTRGTTVLERRRPEYDPVGLPLGSFRLYPQAEAGINATSNVFRQNHGLDDVFAQLRGEAVLRSEWSRHQLVASGRVEQRWFAEYTSEDTTSYNLDMSGRFDVQTGVAVTASASQRRAFQERDAVEETIATGKPVQFDDQQATLGISYGPGRLAASLDGQYHRKNYHDTQTPAGAFLSEQFRDFESFTGRLRLGYEFSPDRLVYASLSHEKRDFRLASTPGRDIAITEALGGIQGDITPLIRGRLAVGYIVGDFKDPAVRSRKGVTFDAALTYLASELTSLSLTARRTIDNVDDIRVPAITVSNVQFQADHELFRNLIVGAGLSYRQADYVNSSQTNRSYGALASGRLLLDRKWQLKAEAAYRKSEVRHPLPGRSRLDSDTFSARISAIFNF